MKIHFIYLSALFILFMFFSFLVRYISSNKGENIALYDELKKDSYNFHQLYDIEVEQYSSNNNSISDTIRFMKSNGDFVRISDFVGDKGKFIIRFNDMGCSSCIKYFKDNIKDVISYIKEIGIENVTVILNTNDPRTLYVFKKQYGFPCDVLGAQLGSLSVVLEKNETVVTYYFCTLSKELVIENCFINIQNSPNRTDVYMKSVKRKFCN